MSSGYRRPWMSNTAASWRSRRSNASATKNQFPRGQSNLPTLSALPSRVKPLWDPFTM